MIDPDKLSDAALDAALEYYVTGSTVSIRNSIAAFLDALLADDEAMERMAKIVWPEYAIHSVGLDKLRAALEAAVQETQ